MLCPHCKLPLAIADRQGVEIDYCPQCRGVWLDRGELDKILERSAQPYAPPPTPQPPPQRPGQWEHHDRDHHHGHYKHKRRKSFLEEVFDF